jgi:hypothetical protein
VNVEHARAVVIFGRFALAALRDRFYQDVRMVMSDVSDDPSGSGREQTCAARGRGGLGSSNGHRLRERPLRCAASNVSKSSRSESERATTNGRSRVDASADSAASDRLANMSRTGTVPTIVPETRQNSVSRAHASQLARSVKWKNVKDLRGKTKMVEKRISV